MLLAGTLGVAVFYDGGFNAAPRVVFAALAAAALAAAVVLDPSAAAGAARRPVLVVLWALALFGAVSVFWTVGFEAASLRWAAVTAGFGAVAVSAAVLGRRRGGVQALAVAICAAAVASGAIGLVAAAAHAAPFADRIGGSWRPGGALEYSSANALLAVSALPALLRAACTERRVLAGTAMAGAAVGAAVLALADSRLELALAAAICGAALAAPRRTLGSGREAAATAVTLLVLAGLAAHLVAGRYTPLGADGGEAARLLGLGVACALPATIWIAIRDGVPRVSRARFAALAVALAASVALALSLAGSSGGRAAVPRYGIEGQGGVLHDRSGLWRASLETFADHPWRGSGANSFLAASAPHQASGPARFAHSIPLELMAELGVLGGVLALALYAASGIEVWRARSSPAAWLLGPAVLAFLAAGLVDWPWHLAGSGAVWALALGGIISSVPVGRRSGV